MDAAMIVVLLVIVVLALIAFFVWRSMQKRKRSEALQERFGPEYERAIDRHDDRRAAEGRLTEVAERRDSLDIRELEPDERRRYAQDWTTVQAAFVDNPARATRDADHLVGRVMRDRGYPVDDFETQSDMVAADHPEIAENYRRAHAVGSRTDEPDTEELRVAFVHYRMLFDELLAEPVDLRDRDTDRAMQSGQQPTGRPPER